ncbi:MAG: 50S ribosomal protein L15 [Candidatus Portnoybacteria bacterium CG10_big_fil_rev_8_21_14_0_10_38_18]|uniref:Large ribosomal subunit protein uL15 n=1 Tax=Candidatus Portnoybacteria bacterium CG10_big_fil_rev_8_21_14_0_10_38_18 TaxID=1974813 RepID=A0A2M8KCE1_9BACT|nr:MAG: 50S ribosomal protein L15 [Candidatus Portnoybacteria bacterium CG10_big_fil_rev_8_21_14_0_10_38_18]
MQLHQVKPIHKQKEKKRVGRGGKHGTYSGRGIKGQKARAGRKLRPEIRDFIKKIPKKRGYRFKSIKPKPEIINLIDLEKHFNDGDIVNPQTLLEKGLISRIKGRTPEVKILGVGELKKKLKIENCKMSKSAAKVLEIKK